MKLILENFRFFLQLYANPQRALSNIMDNGNLLFAAALVLAVAFVFQSSITARLNTIYNVPRFNFETYQDQSLSANDEFSDEESEVARYEAAYENYRAALRNRQTLPLLGDYGLWLFNFNSTNFFSFFMALAIFYVPATILLVTIFESTGSFGVVLRRDYAILLICTLMSWAAAHLPFALVGLLLAGQAANPYVLLSFWIASGLWFGVLMVLTVRTVFGASYRSAIATVLLSWLAINLGSRIFARVSPYLFSPFLLFYAYVYFRGEAGAMTGALRQQQNFRRFLQTATLNPHDAEARVQLGLIYKQRRQIDQATKYFNEALEIDRQEIDANYEMGKIARENNDLPGALERFAIVAEQNDKHAQSEIWREIGATYFDAKAYTEAREFLEKFVERRPFDPEGLYYLGRTLQEIGERDSAQEMFRRCLEAAQTSPDYRRGQQRKWGKLAQKQLA